MEVGTVSHKYYLVNVRLPVYERKKVNLGIGEIKDIRLVVRIRCVTLRLCHTFMSLGLSPQHHRIDLFFNIFTGLAVAETLSI